MDRFNMIFIIEGAPKAVGQLTMTILHALPSLGPVWNFVKPIVGSSVYE